MVRHTITSVSPLPTLSHSDHFYCSCGYIIIDTDTVTVGLTQGFFSASEDSGFVQICVGVLSGDISGMNTISLDYRTIDGTAEG